MKTFVVGVDGSEPAQRAVRWAAELAEKFGGAVKLVYVIPRMSLPPELYGEALLEVDTIHRAEAERILASAEKEITRAGLSASHEVLMGGSEAALIAEVASAPDVELVVVGSTGKGAIKSLMVGSVSTRLLQICTKPVLVVK